jgi:hypothetical protein
MGVLDDSLSKARAGLALAFDSLEITEDFGVAGAPVPDISRQILRPPVIDLSVDQHI